MLLWAALGAAVLPSLVFDTTPVKTWHELATKIGLATKQDQAINITLSAEFSTGEPSAFHTINIPSNSSVNIIGTPRGSVLDAMSVSNFFDVSTGAHLSLSRVTNNPWTVPTA